jgi:hypothetical protein
MPSKRTCEFLHDMIVLLILILVFPKPTQAQSFNWSVADLVRQTVSNELVSVNDVGHHRYRLEESSSSGFETRDMIETRDWLVGRLILRNRQPLPSLQQKLEDERLLGLLKNPDRLEAFRNEQLSRKENAWDLVD